MLATVDALASDLQTALGPHWTVTASMDEISVVTPLARRVAICALAYNRHEASWVIVPALWELPVQYVLDSAEVDVPSAIATVLRRQAYIPCPVVTAAA